MRFLHFTQSGKTSLPVDSDRLYMYIVIPRATNKKIIQSDIVQKSKERKCNTKKYSIYSNNNGEKKEQKNR